MSPTVKNFKPKSTSGSDSGAQLTSLSPFNRISKPQKRDASMSRRGTGNPQHKRHIELHACHPRRILSFLIACWPFLPSLSLLTHGKRARHQSPVVQEFGMGSCWPEPEGVFTVSCCRTSSGPSYPQSTVITPTAPFDQYIIVDSPQTSLSTSDPINTPATATCNKRRITSISQQQLVNQRICCDHPFTDR